MENSFINQNSYTENCSIVIPIILKEKENLLQKIKKWVIGESFSDMQDRVYQQIVSGKPVEGIYKWRKVSNLRASLDDSIIPYSVLFETSEQKEAEKAYFTTEVFQSLYDEKQEISSVFVLSETKKNACILPSEASGKTAMKLQILGMEDAPQIRKVYLLLFDVKIALLVVELEEFHYYSSKADNKHPLNQMLEKSNQEIVEWLFGQPAINYSLPFMNERFVACYANNPNGHIEQEVEISPFFVRKNDNCKQLEEKLQNMGNFFSYYFQMYWLCILQKSEIISVAERANEISRYKRNNFFKERKSAGTSKDIILEYIRFQNEYDVLCCTYDEKGQQFYEAVKESMNLERESEKLEKQINTLETVLASRRGKWQTRWLMFIGVLEFLQFIVFDVSIPVSELLKQFLTQGQ